METPAIKFTVEKLTCTRGENDVRTIHVHAMLKGRAVPCNAYRVGETNYFAVPAAYEKQVQSICADYGVPEYLYVDRRNRVETIKLPGLTGASAANGGASNDP